MAKKNINIEYFINSGLHFEDMTDIFMNYVNTISHTEYIDKLSIAFDFAINTDPSLFKSQFVDLDKDLNESFKEYIEKWISLYLKDRTNSSLNKPLKTYGEQDEALITIVSSSTNIEDVVLEDYLRGHYMYMSAENMNGNILEEYIASVLEPVGWIWCAGSIFKAIDFIYISKENNILLQVKNKYNTENSSSSQIRKDTKIVKWNRLNRPKKAIDEFKPIPNWNKLIELLDIQNDKIIDALNEESYLKFISNKSTNTLDEI